MERQLDELEGKDGAVQSGLRAVLKGTSDVVDPEDKSNHSFIQAHTTELGVYKRSDRPGEQAGSVGGHQDGLH